MRERFGAEVVRDLGEMGIALDVEVLRASRAGLDDERTAHLDHYLDRASMSRGERRGRVRDSFINDLGIGVVQYAD